MKNEKLNMRNEKWATAIRRCKMTLRGSVGVLLTAFLISHFSFLISCSSIDCPVQNTVYTAYNLMKADGTPDTMGIDTLWVWAVRSGMTDTLLINRLCGPKATSMKLHISYDQPEDVFCFVLKDTVKANPYILDSVRIRKEDYPHFESVDCQASFFHRITSVSCTHYFIDSIVVNNPHVNYDATNAHFYLYLKARR